MFRVYIVLFTLAFCSACNASSNDEIIAAPSSDLYLVKTIAEGIDVPWGMVQLPNYDILVSNRSGQLRLISDGQLLERSISGLPEIDANGQGGLLDLALHPDFKNNNWLYFTYSSPEGNEKGSNTALMRAKLNIEQKRIEQLELLYKGERNTDSGRHYGSRIVFDNDGYVFFSIGDRGNRDVNPQRLDLDGGKIYRLHDDGRIPKDNPFVDTTEFPKAKVGVYSYGHRNPQGMAKHPVSGSIWAHEHGPKGGDEINLVKAGKNYGWPIISYGVNYSGTAFTKLTEKEGMEQPIHQWTPSIAPSGMVFVTSNKYPQWQGKLLVGSLKFNYIELLDITNSGVAGQSKLFEGVGRVRSLMQGADGYLYVGVDGGSIKRIEAK
jgi:aldose sugar dehydrogenase